MNLKNKIIQANKAYRSGNAIISDIEYDKLLEQYKQTISINEFEKFTVISDLEEFKEKSDVILANRMEECLKDIQEKIYTRDIFTRD